ncbi:MAG: 4'-phosphopantetheinyl transferase superfamily protein [Pyrinomonadaceae bacterium]
MTDEDVHVWRAYLNQGGPSAALFLNDLSSEEEERSGKYYFRKDRERFVIARGVLRHILGRYLEISPRKINFLYGRYGKPYLSYAGEQLLSFNVSHADDIALYVISKGRRVGIDIEHLREDFAVLEIAERFFSQQEVSTLRALPVRLQTVAFFNCWTRKESYIKALGEGLSRPLDSFAVSLTPGQPATLLATNDPQEASHWELTELFVDKGYVASLTAEGKAPVLNHWQWPGEILRGQQSRRI